MSTYREDLAAHIMGAILGLFLAGWALMIAAGILGHPLGYWPSFVLAFLFNVVFGSPGDAVRLEGIKRKHRR